MDEPYCKHCETPNDKEAAPCCDGQQLERLTSKVREVAGVLNGYTGRESATATKLNRYGRILMEAAER